MLALTFTRYHILASLQRIFNTRLKNCHLFSAVISEHFSKNRVIISVVAAKIWYLKNVRFLLGHPVNRIILHNEHINHPRVNSDKVREHQLIQRSV